VFAIILLVEYRFKRKIAWVLALLLLAGYVTALAIGYQDDAPRPVMSAFTSLISVLTFVGLFGGVILRHRYQLQRDAAGLEERIAERTIDLNKALSERTVMLQEIHHRVKNNMQTISTLLGMEVDKMPNTAAKGALIASQQRIQAMASVHDVLYRSEHLDRVDLSSYTRDLVGTLLQTALCPIELDLQVSEAGTVDLSFAVSLGMTLNELVSNALKHGFDPRTGGKLRVALTSNGQNIVLEVEDNGKGLPDGFVPEEQSGVGMSVVTSIVRHRGGKIDFRSDGGTCWHLELPLSAETG
ncbi:MAG: sensor histidine kinase, partial [Spirochaetaceae bacterium]|nr:sensor histidine kinase [Spirochaetaceae bacterium]